MEGFIEESSHVSIKEFSLVSFNNVLLECLFLMLRPVARFCLKRSLRIQEVIEVAKLAFIEAAEAEIKRGSKKVSLSRLSIMTGVHQKDLVRLHRESQEPKEHSSIVIRVVGHWRQAKKYTSNSGRPRTLGLDGIDSEFCQLVQEISVDVAPYTVLSELERAEMVERTSHGIRLKGQAYMPKGDLKQGFAMMARDVEDLMSAVEENMATPEELPNFHIKTEYDNIVTEEIPHIREWLLHQGAAFHRRAQKFLARYDKDTNPALSTKPGGSRVAIGGFSVTMP